MYPMKIEFTKRGYTIKDGNLVKTLKCPISRSKQWNREYYNFEKETTLKHGFNSFKFIKNAKTHSGLAKRVWDALWEEGWREKQL